MKLFILALIILINTTTSRKLKFEELIFQCHFECDSRVEFNCNCEKDDWRELKPICTPPKRLCDGVADCEDGSDEMDCICPLNEFQCSYCNQGGSSCGSLLIHSLYQCVTREEVEDSIVNCYSLRDYFRRKGVDFYACDGYIQFPEITPNDEYNCPRCPRDYPNRCACNTINDMTCTETGYTCYKDKYSCDVFSDCSDGSDEIDCKCPKDNFMCHCFQSDPPTCYTDDVCIPPDKFQDGIADCADSSDEIKSSIKIVNCNDCEVTIRRLNNTSECNDIGFPSCDNSTCYKTTSLHCLSENCSETEVICFSHCTNNTNEACKSALQCSDGSLILASQFCNGIIDCLDNSDEIRNEAGFKCTRSAVPCVLPQPNLYDKFSHCVDDSDRCADHKKDCFECFDKRLLISSKQVCDGVVDCYDFSDECLCAIHFDKSICDDIFKVYNTSLSKKCSFGTNNDSTTFKQIHMQVIGKDINIKYSLNNTDNNETTKLCETKQGFILSSLCDGRPECKDFSDECTCNNPPAFCSDTCRSFYNSFYPLGDLYCDGIEDEFAWGYSISKSVCPPGFDEKLCPKRFYCKAGEKVSIDVSEVCNGITDCDDGADEDEQNCPVIIKNNLFSSDTEMIDNLVFRIAFWTIGLVVIIANVIAIVTKVRFLKTSNLTNSLRCQHMIILNISFADCVMGIYLLSISVCSAIYSGYYGQVDREWRSSLRCSIIGSLAIISSQASCFLMLVLTVFRLHSTRNPFASLSSRMWPWKMCMCGAWFISVILGILPILHDKIHYYIQNVIFPIEFNKEGTWNITSLAKFVCRYAAMTNKTIYKDYSEWESTKIFLETNFQKYLPIRTFGYYSETSICMPRFYVAHGDSAWEYTLAIMTMNFFIFLSISICYIYLFTAVQRKSKFLNQSNPNQQKSRMQKRIATLIATDFLSWIPICILVFVRISGSVFPNVVYQITAVFLLPINSALNPFLYSLRPGKIISKLQQICTNCGGHG